MTAKCLEEILEARRPAWACHLCSPKQFDQVAGPGWHQPMSVWPLLSRHCCHFAAARSVAAAQLLQLPAPKCFVWGLSVAVGPEILPMLNWEFLLEDLSGLAARKDITNFWN